MLDVGRWTFNFSGTPLRVIPIQIVGHGYGREFFSHPSSLNPSEQMFGLFEQRFRQSQGSAVRKERNANVQRPTSNIEVQIERKGG